MEWICFRGGYVARRICLGSVYRWEGFVLVMFKAGEGLSDWVYRRRGVV